MALDTGLQLLALVIAGWALLAPPPTVLLLTPALPTLALPVPAAHLHDVLPKGGNAGLVAGPALAGRVALHVPLGVAVALATHALSVVLPRAYLSVVTIAAIVIAFTVIAKYHLRREQGRDDYGYEC